MVLHFEIIPSTFCWGRDTFISQESIVSPRNSIVWDGCKIDFFSNLSTIPGCAEGVTKNLDPLLFLPQSDSWLLCRPDIWSDAPLPFAVLLLWVSWPLWTVWGLTPIQMEGPGTAWLCPPIEISDISCEFRVLGCKSMRPSDRPWPSGRLVVECFSPCETLPFWSVRKQPFCSMILGWILVWDPRPSLDVQTKYWNTDFDPSDWDLQSPLLAFLAFPLFPSREFVFRLLISSVLVWHLEKEFPWSRFWNPVCVSKWFGPTWLFPNFRESKQAFPRVEFGFVLSELDLLAGSKLSEGIRGFSIIL